MKQPWEMTQKEYFLWMDNKYGVNRFFADIHHRVEIETAITENKIIPNKVMIDYPDLKID